MRLMCIVLSLTSFFFLSCERDPDANKGFEVKQDKELMQMIPEKPVKIRLKRTAKGAYSWDLTGDDVEKIIEADRKLRKSIQKNERGGAQ